MCKCWSEAEKQVLQDLLPLVSMQALELAIPARSRSAIFKQIMRMRLRVTERRVHRDWRKIANEYKPRIVLAQPFPAEVIK